MAENIAQVTFPLRNALGSAAGSATDLNLDLLALNAATKSSDKLQAYLDIENRLRQILSVIREADEQVGELHSKFAQQRARLVNEITAQRYTQRRCGFLTQKDQRPLY